MILVVGGLGAGKRKFIREELGYAPEQLSSVPEEGTPVLWGLEALDPLPPLEDLLGREELYYHTGSAYGVYALLSYDPNTGDGVVVLTTGAPRQVDDRGLYQLCARLSEQLYAAMEEHEG